MISFLQCITENHDYALQVLLPELIELLLVNTFFFSKKKLDSICQMVVINNMD